MREERWLPVVGYEGLYEVSDLGSVRSVDRVVETFSARGNRRTSLRRRAVLLSQHPNLQGYMTACLSKNGRARTLKVAHLVCEAFHGARPSGMHACHNNGVKTDNRAENLRWGTPRANQADRVAHGTNLRGTAVLTAKLTEDDVRVIKSSSRYADVRNLPVSKTQYYRIRRGEAWKHVS